MKRDDIIAMVQEVIVIDSNDNPFDFRLSTIEQIERFAGLVAAAEREACWDIVSTALFREDRELTRRVASAIRARGNT